MNTKRSVGRRVQTLRTVRNLTQERLAYLIGRSTDAISNLERGKSLPNFETLERLSKVLKVPIMEFFDFADKGDDVRVELLARIRDAARSLSDKDLRVALDQIEALKRR